MAITFPVPAAEFAALLHVRSVRWSLREFIETSGTGSGQFLTAEIAPPKWVAEITTAPMAINDALRARALIRRIGAHGTFLLFDPDTPHPVYDPKGEINEGFTVTVAGVTETTLRLQGLPAGYELHWGDKIGINYGSSPLRRALFEVCEDLAANGSGVTPVFEVNPPPKIGITAGSAVNLRRPTAMMKFLTYDAGGSDLHIDQGMSFTAIEAR